MFSLKNAALYSTTTYMYRFIELLLYRALIQLLHQHCWWHGSYRSNKSMNDLSMVTMYVQLLYLSTFVCCAQDCMLPFLSHAMYVNIEVHILLETPQYFCTFMAFRVLQFWISIEIVYPSKWWAYSIMLRLHCAVCWEFELVNTLFFRFYIWLVKLVLQCPQRGHYSLWYL